MAHELLGDDVQPGLHGGDGHRGVQVQGQGDNHRFQLVVLGVLDQLLVVAVDLDFLAGGVFGLPAVDGQQTGAGLRLGEVVAVERPPHVVGADVGDRPDGDVLRD